MGEASPPARLREERIRLHNEWHARPNLSLPAPFRCTHVVNFARDDARETIADFCRQHHQPPPTSDSRHHLLEVGACRVKWESHTEVTAHTVLVAGNAKPLFTESALQFLPEAKQRELTGEMFVGVQVEVLSDTPADDPEGQELARSVLGSNAIYGGWMADDSAVVWSSFRLDSQGFIRLLVIDRELGEARLSRLLQRLLELETYRMLAMKALPVARSVMAELQNLEPELYEVMERLATSEDGYRQDRALRDIASIASRVERLASEHAFRFSGARAYRQIVERRAEEVRESDLWPHERYTQFLLKSLLPAMRTCDAAERRTHELAERVARAANLLSTMVGLDQAQQSHGMLASMDERAGMQLRLQQAVEGFSIFAISYYAVGLLSYALKGLEYAGVDINATLTTGLSAPLVFALVFISVRWVRHRLVARLERQGSTAKGKLT
jgi:uncharacterized membrane-anchored protein